MSFAEFDDYRNKYRFIADISIHNDISDVYNQVVEFIKSYNTGEIK
jgi:flagellar capping protein FliD